MTTRRERERARLRDSEPEERHGELKVVRAAPVVTSGYGRWQFGSEAVLEKEMLHRPAVTGEDKGGLNAYSPNITLNRVLFA